jgi:methylated-DNA-[protein]-cysteine S-methyltransferase
VTPSSEASSHRVDTPLGPLWLGGDEDGLTEVAFHGGPDARSEDALLQEAAEQLRAYFAGELRRFELPLAPHGTEFQRRVWDAVADIPYGTTSTYSAVAAAIGSPRACRAVGAANGRNPLPIVVPCHRLVGASGALTGYCGGLELKRALLDLEAAAG